MITIFSWPTDKKSENLQIKHRRAAPVSAPHTAVVQAVWRTKLLSVCLWYECSIRTGCYVELEIIIVESLVFPFGKKQLIRVLSIGGHHFRKG